jgi:hypothetical protein
MPEQIELSREVEALATALSIRLGNGCEDLITTQLFEDLARAIIAQVREELKREG